MSEQTGQIFLAPRRRLLVPSLWSVGAMLIATLVVLPILAVIWFALTPKDNVWPHLWATTLPRYLVNTGLLMGATGLLTAMIGAGAAWLVVMYQFPGRKWLEWALLLPLAVPAYVGAFALVDFLEYAG
ncbi:MAG: iron ABC transporter permease, partial [Marivivens sp.]